MAGRKRKMAVQPSTPHRLKTRCATRITATPRAKSPPPPPRSAPRRTKNEKEKIETTRDDASWWPLPLPSSPAPSPPRPKEICPKEMCSLVAGPTISQVFTYRKLRDENDQTQRDALGREVAGRHSIPASEFTRDRSYMTPSTRAKVAHGIEFWPDPPFKSFYDSAARGTSVDHQGIISNDVPPTPPSRNPVGISTTGRKTVTRRACRLFSDEGDGGREGDDENEQDGMGQREEKDDTSVHTAVGAHQDTVSKFVTRKRRRATKAILHAKYRRRLFNGNQSAKSDDVRMMTSSDEELEDEEDNEEEDNEGDNEDEGNVSNDNLSYLSGNFAVLDNRESGEGDLNRTLEVELEESGDDNERSGDIIEDKEDLGRVDENVEGEELEDEDDSIIEGNEEEDEIRIVEDEEEEADENEIGGEDGMGGGGSEEEVAKETDAIEDSIRLEDSSDDGEGTLHEERSGSEMDEEASNGSNASVQKKGDAGGDISLIDNTLPLESVVDSIEDADLRRMLAVCKQKNVMDIEEFMFGVISAVKVGEGSFADAYLIKRKWENENKVFKIIALRGENYDEDEDEEVDDEDNIDWMKKEEDAGKVFGELVISKDLTRLSQSARNSTDAFAKLFRARVVQGLFPPLLSDAWDVFREHDEDAQDELNPKEYGEKQLFLVLECEYGGLSLKKFPFSSVLEIISVYCQTALAMAVAELEFKFEHRDLHEDNVLVKRTEDSVVEFTYDSTQDNGGVHNVWNKSIRVPSHGVKTTIIDFTLSRLTRKSERRKSSRDIVVYHELSHEQCNQKEEAEQYKVYNKMQKLTKSKWELFTPKSNVLWLKMQLNWIIAENLNSTSDLNKKRVETSKTRRTLQSAKKETRKRSMRRSSLDGVDGEAEGREISGETWKKKLKEGSSLITKLKSFVKGIDKFKSAEDLVASKAFEDLLTLLE